MSPRCSIADRVGRARRGSRTRPLTAALAGAAMIRALLLLVALAAFAARAAAHKPSDAYLTVERDGATLRGQWDIALRDLDNAHRARRQRRRRHHLAASCEPAMREIAAYALQRLRIASGGRDAAR